jgi:16S rRNA (adenine1518-N6/adenine1519-N6)-dimethyltransferase
MAATDQLNLSLLTRTRFLLERFDLKARKGLGQHFLVNSAILKRILEAADLSSSDLVIEVGPGIGVLTHELVQRAGWVLAVEIDRKMVEILGETLRPHRNFSLLNRDILEIEPGNLIAEEKANFPRGTDAADYKLVANLPYYITQPIIRHFCEAALKPQSMTVMVQKEVARNIVATPGEMSILAVSVQYYGQPRILSYVPAANFYPQPKVDSAILQINLYPRPRYQVASTREFFRVVRAGFCAARKQIVNSLGQGLEIQRVEALSLLEKSGVDPRRRAETLDLEEWASLARAWTEAGHK